MDMGSKKSQWMLWIFVAFFCFSTHAEDWDPVPYYGKTLYQIVKNNPETRELRQELHRILSHWHIAGKSGFDQIVEDCSDNSCYRHRALSYKNAREVLFGEIHLVENKGQYAVEDVYCDTLRTEDEFRSRPPGPGRIPNPQVINAEHTWPQSRFNKSQPKQLQKSDLHGLYPVNSRVNSSRSNDPFGEVDNISSQICPASKKGGSTFSGRIAFEPPDNHKGNVARALFYFAIRYKMDIDPEEERYLREWHELDPVDTRERDRNQHVFDTQGNRNPFIDHPALVQLIGDL